MHQVLQPPGWAPPRGYANGVAARGLQVHVAGQIGWDAQGRVASGDLGEQGRPAPANGRAVAAGGRKRVIQAITP